VRRSSGGRLSFESGGDGVVAAGVERVVLSHGRNVCAEQLPSEPTGAGWQGRCNAPERGCLRKVCGPWQGQQEGIALRVQCRWPAEIPNFSFAWLSPWQSAAAQCRARMGATSFVNEIDRRSFAGRVSRLEGRRRASTYSFSGMRSGSSWQPMQPRDSRVLTQNQPQVASAMPLVSNVCNSKGVSAGTSTLKEPSTSTGLHRSAVSGSVFFPRTVPAACAARMPRESHRCTRARGRCGRTAGPHHRN